MKVTDDLRGGPSGLGTLVEGDMPSVMLLDSFHVGFIGIAGIYIHGPEKSGEVSTLQRAIYIWLWWAVRLSNYPTIGSYDAQPRASTN